MEKSHSKLIELELNEKMYYACSLCSTEFNVQWHKPGTKTWHEHKKYMTSMKRIQTDQSISGALIISDRMILQENVLDTGL